MGGSSEEGFPSLQQTSDGGYILAGMTWSFGAGGWDLWVLKLDSSGDIPGCNIIGTSYATITNTSVVGQTTSAAVALSSATVTNTSITPRNTSAMITTICIGVDTDGDGILDDGDRSGIAGDNPCSGGNTIDCDDNCPVHYNPDQLDTFPPQGNGIGDACDCEGNFDCDRDVDAADVTKFLYDFGRNRYYDPCTNERWCYGDFSCNGDVDAQDVTKFLEDFGRSQYNNPCPACNPGISWCNYE